MSNLFLDLKFEKTSMTKKISKNSSEWAKDVTKYFYNTFPELSNLPINIDFNEMDKDKGYAVGSIFLDKKVHLPIIIKDHELYPLDVAISGETTMPFNESTIQLLFSNMSPFAGLKDNTKDDRFSSIFSNDLETMVPREKQAGITTYLINNLSDSQKKKLLSEMETYKKHFVKNGAWDRVESLEVDESDLTADMLGRDLYMIEKSGNYEYTVFTGKNGVDLTDKSIVPEYKLKEVSEYLEKNSKFNDVNLDEVPNPVKAEGRLVDFSGESLHLKLALDSENNYEIMKFENSPEMNIEFTEKISSFQAGDLVSMKLNAGTSKPFFIEKISNINDEILVQAFDGLKSFNLSFNNHIKEASISEDSDIDFYYPKETACIKLGSNTNFVEEKKTGSHFIMKKAENNFSFGGEEFSKYAKLGHNIDSLNSTESKWTMLQMGVSPKEIEKISFDNGNKYYFVSEISAPISVEDKLAEIREKIAEYDVMLDKENFDIIKAAASMTDDHTVDSILSLNYLNEKNIKDFIKNIPAYEQILSSLSKLLLSVRIGLESIPEESLEYVIEHLSKIVKSLYEVSELIKVK
jgi:hypothetical protein